MKENSIEATIKQLKLILKVRKEQKEIIECAGGSCMNCDPDIKALNESIEILSDYKRALKENEEYYRQLDLEYTEKNFISKQKIKDKIEELDIAISECEYSDDDDEEYKEAVEKDKLCLLNQKRALQELIEERREK